MIFKQATLNDLSWLIKSPGLLNADIASVISDDELLAHFPDFHKMLCHWDAHPEQVDALLTANTGFVGDYFENLIKFYLKNHPALSQVRSRQSVYQNKRSVGEFDFLFINNQTQKTHHWEVAVKFYLQHGNMYYGPNAKDRLDLKVDKMLHKQIKLSKNPAAAETLKDYPLPIKASVVLKGMLFYPSNSDWLHHADTEEYLSEYHLRGWWSYAHNLILPENSANSLWLLLRKPYWLCSYGPQNREAELMDYRAITQFIRQHFQCDQRPIFLAELMQNPQGQYRELSRGFVVTETWPNTD